MHHHLPPAGLAVNHYPEIAAGLARAGRYDLVCYGHDHTLRVDRVGATWLVNPGELMGRFGRSTYLLFDTSTGTATVRELSGRPSRVIVSRETQTRLRLNNGMNLIDKSGRPFSDG